MPCHVRVECRAGSKAKHAELKTKGSGSCHTSVIVRIGIVPRKVTLCLITKLHDEVHCLCKCISWINHLLGSRDSMVKNRNTTQITEHVGVCDSDTYLCLSLHLCDFFRCSIRNPVSVLDEKPAVTDSGIVFLRTEAVSLASCVSGHTCTESTIIIKVLRTVRSETLVTLGMIGDTLEHVTSQFGIICACDSVRKVCICCYKHLVSVLLGCEESLDGST